MTTQLALLLFGGFLLLIAILGGGFEVREVKVPQVGKAPRVASGLGGVLFIVMGLGGSMPPEPQPDKSSPSVAALTGDPRRATGQPVQFVIYDELGPAEIKRGQSERIVIRIDGNSVDAITVNPDFSKSELTLDANEGQHSFAIEAKAVHRVKNIQTEINCFGTGLINVTAGSRFSVEGRYDKAGGPCLLWLQKR